MSFLIDPVRPRTALNSNIVSYETSAAPTFVTFLQAGETENVAFDAGTGAGRVLIVCVIWQNRGQDVTGVTYNSVAMTSVAAKVDETILSGHVFRLANPASGSNTIAVTMASNGISDSFGAIAAWVANTVDGTTPVDGFQSGTGTGTGANIVSQPSAAITSAVGDRIVVFNAITSDTATRSATPTNYTERQDSNDGASFSVEFGDADGAASVSPSATWNSVGGESIHWISLGFNVNASGAAGRTTKNTRPFPLGRALGIQRGVVGNL